MNIDKLKKETKDAIFIMPSITPDRIDGTITKADITKAGVVSDGSHEKQYGAISEYEALDYLDFVRRLQDDTGLLSRTIIDIIVGLGRSHDFYVNPEECICRVSKILL